MTNSVQRDQSPVEPMIFSHESTAEPVTRPATGTRVHDVDFSAHTAASSRQPAR